MNKKIYLISLLLLFPFISSGALAKEGWKKLPENVIAKIEKGDIVVQQKNTDRCYGVYAYAVIDNDLEHVWRAATDFDNFKDFMPNTLKSKAAWKDETPYYHGVIKFLFIVQNYVIKHALVDEPDRKVDSWEIADGVDSVFEEESTFTFSISEGTWALERYGDGKTFSDYHACINFSENIPQLIKGKATKILLGTSVPQIIKSTAKHSKELKEEEKQ